MAPRDGRGAVGEIARDHVVAAAYLEVGNAVGPEALPEDATGCGLDLDGVGERTQCVTKRDAKGIHGCGGPGTWVCSDGLLLRVFPTHPPDDARRSEKSLQAGALGSAPIDRSV